MNIKLEKSETESQPTNYYLICDNSYSMVASIKTLKKTLQSMKTLIGSKDTITLAWFSDDYDWVVKGAAINTNTFDDLVDKNIYARGCTCFSEVLESLVKVIEDVSLSSGNKNNSLLFLTDGWANSGGSHSDIIKICDKLKPVVQESRIIGYSGYYNRELLLDMAKTVKGQFTHISDHYELEKDCNSFMKNKKQVKNVKLEQQYDYLWQVSANDVAIYQQNDDLSVDVLNTKDESQLFGLLDFEVDNLIRDAMANPDKLLTDSKFVYSLATVLSKANKANLGVQLLRLAGDTKSSKMLQRAFTVDQKGRAENELINKALTYVAIDKQAPKNTRLLKDFLKQVEENIHTNISINLDASKYNSTSKNKKDVTAVKFKRSSNLAKIVEIKGNENRPNINFLTVQKGHITAINDEVLRNQVDAFNQFAQKKIELPFECETFRNYTLVSNGDFNFESLVIEELVNKFSVVIEPKEDIELFDPETKSIHIKDFVNLNKNLIHTKAHVSTLNWYIKNNSVTKHRDDLRLQWGPEGAKLLEELGLDYKLRWSADKEKETPKDENSDYLPILEIDTYISKCSKISAKDSFAKWEKKGKANAVDEVMWKLFEKYEQMKSTLPKELFVKALQTELEGLTQTVKVLSQEVANQKFFVISTNSWFEGVDKSDSFEYDGLVVNTKIVKEYI
jgi:hypothetical protein